jgi:hypothetical protein
MNFIDFNNAFIFQLSKHNLMGNAAISSGGTITTTSNVAAHSGGMQQTIPTTNTTTVNLNLGSLQHQAASGGTQHATLLPATNLITTNQSQPSQTQQISFNQAGGNQSHQIVTVSEKRVRKL